MSYTYLAWDQLCGILWNTYMYLRKMLGNINLEVETG